MSINKKYFFLILIPFLVVTFLISIFLPLGNTSYGDEGYRITLNEDGLAIEYESIVFEKYLVEAEKHNKLIEDYIDENVVFKDYKEIAEMSMKDKNIVPTITIDDTEYYSVEAISRITDDLVNGGMMVKLDDETESIVEQGWFDRRRDDTGEYITLNVVDIEDENDLKDIEHYQALISEILE